MNSITWLAMLAMLAFQFRTSPASDCFNETIPFNDVRDSNGSLSDIPRIDGETLWCSSDAAPYLQINFGSVYAVCAVAVQGFNVSQEFTLSLSFVVNSTVSWFPYEEEGSGREFVISPADGDVIINQELLSPQPASFMRIYPTAVDDGSEACLRVEVYGRPAVRVTCGQNGTVEVNIARGVIGTDIRNLTLNNASCYLEVPVGDADITFRFSVAHCGTLASEFTGDEFLYFYNTIHGQVVSPKITVTHDVRFPVVCKYHRNDSVSKSFRPSHNVSSSLEGFGQFTFSLVLFIGSDYNTPYNGQILDLKTHMLGRVDVAETSIEKVLMINRCWATPTSNSDDAAGKDLIVDNCQVEDLREIFNYSCYVGSLSQKFWFSAFRFAHSNVVYIHCIVRVCRNETGNACDESCNACRSSNGRKRRSLNRERLGNGEAAEKLYRVDFAPFTVKDYDDGQQTKDSVRNEQGILDTTGIIIIVISSALVVAIVCATLFMTRRIHRKPACDSGTDWAAAQNGGYIQDKPPSTEA